MRFADTRLRHGGRSQPNVWQGDPRGRNNVRLKGADSILPAHR